MKVFYHSADLDGHCSGAILKLKYPQCDLFGVNYGKDEFVESIVNDAEEVFIVDYSLQPFERMVE